MKKLILTFLCLPMLALGQTFPVNNLQINGAVSGNVSGTGNVLLQTSPSITTPAIASPTLSGTVAGIVTGSGNVVLQTSPTITSPTLSGTTVLAAPPTIGAATVYPTVPTNAALMALSTATTSTVVRLGFYAAGDAPPLVYTASGSACSLGAGNGDNGSQVKSADSKCWIANMPVPADVREWGAKTDGVTDATTAIQNGINFVQSLVRPGRLLIPVGAYVISSSLSVTSGIVIEGDGINATVIQPTVSTIAFAVNTAQATTIKGLNINYTSPQNTGLYAITVTAPSTSTNSISTLRDIQIAGADSGVQFTKSAFFLMDHCFIENFVQKGVEVSNANSIDVGDSIITNSTFFNFVGAGSGTGVLFLSSGGLRITNNKFGALAYGVNFNYATNAGSATSNTAQLMIANNSFDTMATAAVSMTRQTNTDVFNAVVIADNNMPGCGTGVSVPLDASGVWLSSVIITGNMWLSPASGTNTGFAIQSTKTINITNNTLNSQATNTTGISIGSSVTGGLVQLNNLASPAVAFSTTIVNSGTNVTVANNAT